MVQDPVTVRHYPKVGSLRPRTSSDISAEARDGRLQALDFLRRSRGALPDKPRLVSSAHGAIRALLLTIPAYAVTPPAEGETNPLGKAYRNLLLRLPKQVRLVILTHEAVRGRVSAWLKRAGHFERATLIAAPDHLHFSIWAEDGYVVVEDEDSEARFLLEPYEFPRYGDALIADFVRNETEIRSNQAPLYFQGGNLLIGDDFFLIGADYPANSLRYLNRVIAPEPGERPADTIHRLYRQYMDESRELLYVGSTIPVPSEEERTITINDEEWTEVVYFGNRPGTVQPLFHIDMFLSLAGRDAGGAYQILVGDPSLAAKALRQPVWPHAMQEVFENIAAGLATQGFRVIRNPLPLVYVDDPESRTRIWYFATSNNALVQIDEPEDRQVWLPTYGHGSFGRGKRTDLRRTDRLNRDVWQSLGFQVHLLGDFHPFAENLGALHCIKKYLSRG